MTDGSSNLHSFMQKVLYRVGELFPPPRVVIPLQDRRLETCKLFKECGSCGLELLPRETARGSNYCLCKFICLCNTEIFSALLVAKVFNCVDFHYSVYIQTGTGHIRPVYPPFCSTSSTTNMSTYHCQKLHTFRWQSSYTDAWKNYYIITAHQLSS